MEDLKIFMKDESISLFNQALSLVCRDSQIPSCFSQPHLETDFQTNPFPATKKEKRHQTLRVFPYTMKHNTPSKCQTLLDFYWSFVTEARLHPSSPNPLQLPYLQTVLDHTKLAKKWKWGSYLWASGFLLPDGGQVMESTGWEKSSHRRIMSYSPSAQIALRVHFNISKTMMEKLHFKIY